MRKILILLYILISFSYNSQVARTGTVAIPTAKSMMAGAFIDVNSAGYAQSNYTVQQLIQDVLITGGANCTASVTNVIVSPNLAANNASRSWGYFNKGTTNFPFNDGIILMTGHANEAGNNFIFNELSGNLNTGGDADLATAIGTTSNQLEDATYIQFDFVPVTNEISFNYIFASEEYEGSFPCSFTDGFALLIKKVTDPNYTNIAVLPGGAGSVNVKNIRPATQFNGQTLGCGALNAQYFAGYNNAAIETNFSGRTIPLTATATVIPGQTYRFKMVLADNTDNEYDTGVFIQAGSFNIGVQLTDPSGNPLGSNINICNGSSQVLNAEVAIPGATYQWFLNNIAISGATGSTYTATQAGVYSVQVNVPGTTCPGTAQITVNVLPLPQALDTSLSQCSLSPTATFNLTSAQASISNTVGATFSYYNNLADAIAGNTNTINNTTAYTSANTTIYVKVTGGQCSDIAELQLIVNPTPATPTIAASALVICGNGSVTLTSNFSAGNTWSTGETTQTITVSTAGTYTLTNSNGICTSAPASITIASNPNPNLQITGNNFFCTGSSTVLTVSGTGTGITYLWSNGITTPALTVNTSGTYTVTATTSGGCQFQQSVTVSEFPVPNVQNAVLSACSVTGTFTFDLTSAQPNISTSSGVTFTYYTSLADANAGNTNNITNPTSHNSGTAIIYVRVSNGNCFKIAELQLNVGITPTPVISQSAPAICGTTPVTLTSNYATGNVWSTGATTQSIIVSTPGTYTLTVTNGNCTSSPVSLIILQNADPNLNITGNLTFCQGSTTTLTANVTGTGYTFLWSNGSTAQTTTVNTAGTYNVTVTTPAGCQYTDSVTVTMDAPININITQPSQITCTNPSITINAANSTFQTGATIQWTTSGGGNIVSGANTLTPVVNEGGNYTLTITNNFGNNCSQQSTVTVIENNLPPVISLASNDMNICVGESVTLTASGAQTYTWTGLSGTGNTQVVAPTSTTTYTVTGVGANGCLGNTTTITINVVPEIISTLQNVQFCIGNSEILDAGSGPNYTYLWNTGATTQTISVNTAGPYTVTIDNGACTKTFSANASYTPIPIVKEIVYENNSLNIIIDGPNTNLEYSINGGLSWQSSNVFVNILNNSNYNISVRYKDEDCYNSIDYYTFYVTNAITPNGDGINEYVDFTGVSKYKNFSAAIYDRYGKQVFKAVPNNTIWNGTYINFKVNTETYWYQVTWIDPISNKTIIRNGWILVKNRD